MIHIILNVSRFTDSFSLFLFKNSKRWLKLLHLVKLFLYKKDIESEV